jgi:hypothetical protein
LRYNDKWPVLFNAIIETLNLREIELTGRKFTWANYAEIPTYEKLDRILVTTEWEQKFLLATVQALTREISDHTPLLLDGGELSHRDNARNFKFELGWLTRDGFFIWLRRCGNLRIGVGHPWNDDNPKLEDYDDSLEVGLEI